ncbi:MAG TPA: oligosaccharide flippase family protein [Candidatus Paceibacterota bacterium]|nr:oligosaccharide flippase family protein [Candidatus Paceibacterota bacterium]
MPVIELWQERLVRLLRWSERYTKTDMVYLAGGGFWITLSSICISLFSLALYVAFAHFLPKDVYGNYQYLLSITAIAGGFTLSGMNSAVGQAVARGYEGTLRASIPVQLRWGLLSFFGAFAGGAYYAFVGNYTLAIGFILVGLLTPIVNTYNTYMSFLLGKKDFMRVFLYNFATNIPFYALLILASFFFKNPVVLLAVNLGSTAIMLAWAYRKTIRVYRPNDRVDEEALRYGKHLTIMGVFSMLVSQLDSILVFHFLGAVDLALYSFATAVPDRLAGLFKFVPLTALPKFSEKSSEEIRSTLGPKLIQLTAVVLLGAGMYMIVAPLFFQIFFPQYEPSVPYSILYALSMLTVVGNIPLTALTAQRHTRELYIYNIISPLLQLILLYGGIITWGLWGLVGAKVVSAALTSALSAGLFMYGRAASRTDN